MGRIAPESIRIEPKASVDVMERASADALGVSKRVLHNMRSTFKTVLRERGLLAPAQARPREIQSSEWQRLFGLLSDTQHPHRLVTFITWCDGQGIPPERVTSDTLESYLAERVATEGGTKGRGRVLAVAQLWNKYRLKEASWPRQILALRPVDVPRSPDLSIYPEPLQADITRFLEGVSRPEISKLFGGIARDDQGGMTVRPILSPKTIEARRKGVRSLLWGATAIGIARETITSLDLLIRPEVAEPILEWHYTRMGLDAPSAGLVGFMDTLTAIAAYKGITGKQQQALRTLFRAARPKRQTEMSSKMAGLITILEQSRPRELLLGTPFKIMEEARRIRDGGVDGDRSPAPMRAAWLAALAVAIEVELHLPIRVLDLASLDMDRHLARLDKGRAEERWHLGLNARKNGMRIETELSHESAAVLREYVEVFRPLGPHADTRWLFPHRDRADIPRPEGHFSEAISEQIRRHTGIEMHVHAFRAFAALLIIEQDPHALEDIRAILGHKSFDTAWRFYMRHNRIAAGARLGKTISDARRDLLGRR